jgi:hypothetical protein
MLLYSTNAHTTAHCCCCSQDIVNHKAATELCYFVVRLSDTVTGTKGLSIDKPLPPSFLFMGAVMRTVKVSSTQHMCHTLRLAG